MRLHARTSPRRTRRYEKASARRRRLCAVVLLATFVAKLFVPPGYMAAPLSSGSPIQLCPIGLPDHFLPSHHHDHHHHHVGDESLTEEAAEGCALGALASAAGIAVGSPMVPPGTAPSFVNASGVTLVPDAHERAFRARAPPRLS